MATEHIVALLIQERDKLNRAIEALQGTVKRRGRPPKNRLSVSLAVNPDSVEAARRLSKQLGKTPKKRKPFSAATKRKMALAQKKRWAEKKAAK